MNEQQKIEEVKLFLDRENHENAITVLENCIEENSEELIYYWYLGLVYLLQKNEELAQEVWFCLLYTSPSPRD